MSEPGSLPLALTLGEPAGIGPELTIRVWRRRQELRLPPFYLVGDPDLVRDRARQLGSKIALSIVTPAQAAEIFPRALPIVPLQMPVTAAPGKPDGSSAPAAIASIRRAVSDVLAGQAAGIVTNPVAKNVLYRSGFAEPGHTEFLAKLVEEAIGKASRPVMMLWSPELAVVPVTIHLPLKDVVSRLTFELVVETGRITAHDLTKRFGILRPRLAVAGLNRMPAKMAHLVRKMLQLSRRPSNVCAPKGSMLLALFQPTRSFTNGHARPMTLLYACITTRR
jgi:4-hydroxythreonine-4-phosphate dehydrogenase